MAAHRRVGNHTAVQIWEPRQKSVPVRLEQKNAGEVKIDQTSIDQNLHPFETENNSSAVRFMSLFALDVKG